MNAIINAAAKNPFFGFRFNVVQRTVSRTNANSLGRFEQVGGGEYVEQLVYNDVVVNGSDYLVNASRYAAELREANKNPNVVFIIKQN